MRTCRTGEEADKNDLENSKRLEKSWKKKVGSALPAVQEFCRVLFFDFFWGGNGFGL